MRVGACVYRSSRPRVRDRPGLAPLLLAGIYNDTLSLQKLVSSPETFQVLKELFARGGDLERCVDTMYRDNTIELLKRKGELLSRIAPRCEGRYLPIVLDLATIAQRNLTEHDLAPLKNLPMDVSGVVVGAVIRVDGDLCKVSLRSKGAVDVRAIAEQFSGQGHLNVSGFAYRGWVGNAHLSLTRSTTGVVMRAEDGGRSCVYAPMSPPGAGSRGCALGTPFEAAGERSTPHRIQ